jgi:hypothetical protein
MRFMPVVFTFDLRFLCKPLAKLNGFMDRSIRAVISVIFVCLIPRFAQTDALKAILKTDSFHH